MSLPRVLIVGQPFNNATGGGITLSNLFAGWDKDKIAVACFSYYFSVPVDTTICDRYYQLGFEDNKWFFPFSLIQNKHYSGPVTFSKKEEQRGAEVTNVKEVSSLRKKMVTGIFFLLCAFQALAIVYLTRN